MKIVPRINTPAVNISQSSDLSALRAKVGFFNKIDVAIATSQAAAEQVKRVIEEQTKTEADIALTSLKLTGTAIRSAMVAKVMPQIGALTTCVNTATAAVDQKLTSASSGEVYTHISNRAVNITLAEELRDAGKITPEEAEVLISFAQTDAAEDIKRSRQRMTEAKEVVDSLRECAIAGIIESKDRLIG